MVQSCQPHATFNDAGCLSVYHPELTRDRQADQDGARAVTCPPDSSTLPLNTKHRIPAPFAGSFVVRTHLGIAPNQQKATEFHCLSADRQRPCLEGRRSISNYMPTYHTEMNTL